MGGQTVRNMIGIRGGASSPSLRMAVKVPMKWEVGQPSAWAWILAKLSRAAMLPLSWLNGRCVGAGAGVEIVCSRELSVWLKKPLVRNCGA